MLTEKEINDMSLIHIDKNQVEQICLDVMKERLFDYEVIKEELRQLNSGERVVLPVSKEHAQYMLILAMHYLDIKPGEPLIYTKD